MSNEFELQAEVRSDMGKGASRRLRREADKVPAIIYGANKDPMALSFPANKVRKALENEAFYSHILTIDIDGKKEKAVLKDLQRHPYKKQILHMDFLRVKADSKLHMNVPLHFTGEDVAPGVKLQGGVVSHTINEVEITCLPSDLPEFIEVDLSNLDVDQVVHLSDIKLPKGVELVAFSHGNVEEHDLPVANIHMPRAAVEEDEGAPEAPEAPEVVGEDKAADSEEKSAD